MVLTISAVFIFLATQTIERGVSSLHLGIAQHAKSIITGSFERFFAEQERIAADLGRRQDQWSETLALALKNNPAFEQIAFTDARGKEFARLNRLAVVDKSELKNYSQDENFQQAITKNGLVGRVFFSERAEPLLSMFTPIRTPDGELAGMLITDINLKFMWNLMAKIRVGNLGRAYVVDNLGNLIADPDPSLVLRRENLLSRPIVKKVVEGTAFIDGLNSQDRYKNTEGQRMFSSGIFMENLGWGVFTEEPLEDAFLASRRTLAVGISLASASIILLLFLLVTIRRLFGLTDVLEKERVHFSSMVSYLTDGVVEYSSSFTITFLNPEAEKLLGVKLENLIGRSLENLSHERDVKLESLLKIFPEALRSSESPAVLGEGKRTEEFVVQSPLERTLQVTTVPVMSPEKTVLSRIKIVRDITREKLLDRLKSEFISIAAHQLRTPLSAIKWVLRLLIDGELGPLTKNQREYLESGYDTNEHMITLVNDLLNVSRIEEGRFEYSFRDEDLADLVEKTIKSLKALADSKGIHLNFIKPPKRLEVVSIDSDKIRMALQILFENAIQYTRTGGRIEVGLSEEAEMIVVRVSDTGIGILAEDLKRLFTKFHRSSEAIRMNPNGSGLGLFIARNIILSHGGLIEVESRVGKGSTFLLKLPVRGGYLKKSSPREAELTEFMRGL